MTRMDNGRTVSRRKDRWPILGAGLFALALAACDTESLVQLEDPDLITQGVVQDTANIDAVRNGALFEFSRAYTGPAANNANPGIIGLSGLLADELWYASTFPTMREIDSRRIDPNNGGLLTVFRYVQRARNLAERAAELYDASPRKGNADHALMINMAGYSYIFLAENYCNGVPISQANVSGELEFGPPQTTEQLLNTAIQRFDAAMAMAQAANSTAQVNLARVGKARALQGLGQFTQAANLAAQVPSNFEYFVDYSPNTTAPNNGVWYNINSERRSSAASGEGVNGIRFFRRGASNNTIDPRTPADSVGSGLGTNVPHYRQTKYASRGADVMLASGTEARLIEAEGLLNRGQSNAYLPILNQLRSSIGLLPLVDPVTPSARVRQLYEERAFWLWLTAHRLADLRRMVRHYQFPAESVFPVGTTIFGSEYGPDVNMPIPFFETNNPEYTGQCIDRNA